MLILYTKDGCQYCVKVKDAFSDRNVTYEERNIKDPQFLKEVQEYGARSLPLMVDTSANTTLAESDEIIDYASEYSF